MKHLMTVALAGVIALGGTQAVASAQQPSPPATPQQLFEAGQYDQALQALGSHPAGEPLRPADHFLEAQILLRMSPPETDRAKAEFDAIQAGDDPGWTLVAESGRALADNDTATALQDATQATMTSPDLFAAFYQLGLVKATREDWTGAAAAFERATEIDPMFAYAHYYAGLAYSRLKRVDREASHFDAFVKLAPKAPERLAVESIMRTIRGR